MQRSIAIPIVSIGVLLSGFAASASEPDWIDQAIRNMEQASSEDCSYRLTSQVGDGENVVGTQVERFDPSAPGDGWTLVSVEGRSPSTEELKAYAGESAERAERESPCVIDLRDLARPGSLQLVGDDGTHVTYRFRPNPEGDENAEDAELLARLVGTLRVDKSGPYVTEVVLNNPEPFSPERGTKIQHVELAYEFAPIAGDAFAVVAFQFHWRYREYFVRKVEEKLRITYTDVRPGSRERS